jgi:hypothetical protein
VSATCQNAWAMRVAGIRNSSKAGLASAHGPQEQKAIEQQLLDADLPRIETDLREELKYTRGIVGRHPASPMPDLAQARDNNAPLTLHPASARIAG